MHLLPSNIRQLVLAEADQQWRPVRFKRQLVPDEQLPGIHSISEQWLVTPLMIVTNELTLIYYARDFNLRSTASETSQVCTVHYLKTEIQLLPYFSEVEATTAVCGLCEVACVAAGLCRLLARCAFS